MAASQHADAWCDDDGRLTSSRESRGQSLIPHWGEQRRTR